MARRHWLIAVLAGLTAAPPAHAAPAYPLYGAGSTPLRPGIVAAEADIHSMPLSLASHPGGAVAFAVDGVLYTLRGSRLVRVPAPAQGIAGIAFGPAGDLLVATCPDDGAGQVFRVAPDRSPTVIAGQPKATRASGDGGPATAAGLECVNAVDVGADAGIRSPTARRDACAGSRPTGRSAPSRASRKPQGGLFPTSIRKPAGDGGPATAAVLGEPIDVAALPGGGFAILDGEKVRIVGGDGVITTMPNLVAAAIAPRADGLVILEPTGRVWQRTQDGRLTLVTDLSREPAGITPSIPVANDPFGPGETLADDVVAAPDGGVLFSADFVVHYVPPPSPQMLAVAIRPATRVPATKLTVRVATTGPAQLRIGVWRDGRRAALVTTNVAGGEASIPIPRIHGPGLYVLHIQAADHHQVAAATASVLVGRRLPMAYARGFIRSWSIFSSSTTMLRTSRSGAGG